MRSCKIPIIDSSTSGLRDLRLLIFEDFPKVPDSKLHNFEHPETSSSLQGILRITFRAYLQEKHCHTCL